MELQSDKDYHRKALALLVCFFVAFMYVETVLKPYTQGNTPQKTQNQAATQTNAGDTATVTPTAAPSVLASPAGSEAAEQSAVPAVAQSGLPSDSQVRDAGLIEIKTKKHRLNLSLLGGRITELHLRDYKATQKKGAEGLNLVQHSDQTPYPLGVFVGEQSDVWTMYEVVSGIEGSALDLSSAAEAQQVILRGSMPDGQAITKTLTFSPNSYLIDVKVDVSGATQLASLEWNRFLPDDDASLLDPYNTQGFVWFDGTKARREAASEFSGSKELGPVKWVSLADKYFTATLIAADEMRPSTALKTASIYRMQLSGTNEGVSAQLLAGPKSYKLLSTLGHNLELNIDFGKLAFISAPLLSVLFFFYGIFGNYGLAIVTLTIVVRLLLYPLNSASFKQMKKMQDLKPEMDRIREQYPDRQEQQMQLMAMYKKHNVNPVGGCLPMLLQMPVFLGLYSALMLAVELRHADFALWITDLSGPEALMIAGFGVPVMVILFVISMVVQQWMTPTQMDPTQKKMMMIMPVVLGFMFASFPSGLTLYWLTSNLISIGQQKGLYWAHDGGKSALKITLAVSVATFMLAFVLTLF